MFFRPANSLILVYDPIEMDELEKFQTEWAEVRKYYRLGFLSQITKMGTVALVIAQARKTAMMQWIPYLLGEGIPFSLGLDPSCIGLNRLPVAEENRLRSETGILDLNRQNPLRYFTTWGKIVELPAAAWEPVLVPQTPDGKTWAENLAFIQFQLKRSVQAALIVDAPTDASAWRSLARENGLKQVVGKSEGEVTKRTDLFDLPRWRFPR